MERDADSEVPKRYAEAQKVCCGPGMHLRSACCKRTDQRPGWWRSSREAVCEGADDLGAQGEARETAAQAIPGSRKLKPVQKPEMYRKLSRHLQGALSNENWVAYDNG